MLCCKSEIFQNPVFEPYQLHIIVVNRMNKVLMDVRFLTSKFYSRYSFSFGKSYVGLTPTDIDLQYGYIVKVYRSIPYIGLFITGHYE